MVICDSHIHVGQFRDVYTSPKELVTFLEDVGVDKFAVSSTSIWEENYNKVLDEIKTLMSLAGQRIVPVLWITPSMLLNNGLSQMLDSDIKWRCVKIHGVHPWDTDSIKNAVGIAQSLHCPFLMHTGGYEQCEAGQYSSLVKNNPNVTFILAHARPIDQTIEIMQQCPNAWADTAFTPIENIRALIDAKLSDRVLWGTDYPIQRAYYKDAEQETLYLNRINEVRGIMSPIEIEKVFYSNYNRLFFPSN